MAIKILVVFGTRPEAIKMLPLCRALHADKECFETSICVTAQHREMLDQVLDIFDIKPDIDLNIMKHGQDLSDTTSLILTGMRDLFSEYRPDLVLVHGDTTTTLASAMAAFLMNIPIAHIQGGEVTGTADESIRHAVTKLSNFHFVANSDAKKRLIRLGEYKKNIFNFGCPYIDVIKKTKFSLKKNLFFKMNLDPQKKTVIFIQHSVTSEIDKVKKQIQITINALKEFKDIQIVSIFSNSDAGGKFIIDKLKKNNQFKVLPNIESKDFLSLMKHADAMIGNTSAAIREAPSFSLPAVNIGTRQNKRLRAINVIDCEHNKIKIVNALNKALYNKKFLSELKNIKNPYGDGNSAKKIVNKLLKINSKNFNIQKTISY